MPGQPSSEDLETRYRKLTERNASLEKNANLLEARLESRKSDLKLAMDECLARGHDPNDLDGVIRRMEEVLHVKLDTFESDIKAGEELIAPMLSEIK